ncbi:MAG TPA: glycosyltransferase family 2 protein [Phycisphaerae bacterium]|nr:glycosyltransferase family 2 protein [Phycisphaerae bacterium]HUT61790.1 glycosyltransferase family 2 protein [Phycisphaerae bacterium]
MHILAVVIAILTGCVGLIWASRHIMLWRERRRAFVLTEQYPGPPAPAPRISVFVAAKDEADNIETCLRTMLNQDYSNFELIVCNDRSSDQTPQIVERIAREDARVRLVNIEHLPDGWCGKNNAMQTGIASTDSEWICMIDADCRQTSTRTLSAAMQYALDNGADMLSVLPVLEMRGFWENVVQPVCGGVMMIWFLPDRVNDPRKRTAYANGAFILIKRSAYEAVGTHQAVRDQVNEDMHMAALLKRAGLSLRVVRSSGLYLVRMYTSLREIVRGWSRIFYGTFGTAGRLAASFALMLVMGPLPYLGAAAGLALAGAAVQPTGWWWACGVAGAVTVAVQVSVVWRFRRLIGARADLAWTYLLGCIVTLIALAGSFGKLGRGAKVVWRDTTYTRGAGSS